MTRTPGRCSTLTHGYNNTLLKLLQLLDISQLLSFFFQTYKPPSSQDIPENFRTYLHDTGTNTGVFSSKATKRRKNQFADNDT